MVMFLSVGLVRSMSMFMYDLNLQMWKKKKNIVCCIQGRGLWVSVEGKEQSNKTRSYWIV